MPRRYTISPCGSGDLGAVITDLDLATILEYDLEYLKHDWLKYKVIVIKNQHDLTAEQFARLGEQWGGELEFHEQQLERGNNRVGHEEGLGIKSTGHPAIHAIHHNRESPAVENYWHMDTSYLEYPPFVTAIHMLEKPAHGGDTLFADTNAMYENMNSILKEKAQGKTARHGARLDKATPPEKLVAHPLIMVHPETGLYHLNANPYFTLHVDGMEERQGFMLLRHMFDNNFPEFQYRHVWEQGDVLIWDNRSVWHYAVSDYWPKERKLQRWISFDTSRAQAFDMAPSMLDDSRDDIKRRNSKYRGQVQRLKHRTGFNGID